MFIKLVRIFTLSHNKEYDFLWLCGAQEAKKSVKEIVNMECADYSINTTFISPLWADKTANLIINSLYNCKNEKKSVCSKIPVSV